MPQKFKLIFFETALTVLLISIAIGPSPACSAAAFAVLLAYGIADKYFHDSFHDDNRKSIVQLKADYAKIKVKQDQSDLKSAFGGKNG